MQEKDNSVSILLSNLGYAYQIMGDYPSVIHWTEKALKIDREIFGEEHTKVAIKYNNLGMAYNSLGKYEKAIGYYIFLLTIIELYSINFY